MNTRIIISALIATVMLAANVAADVAAAKDTRPGPTVQVDGKKAGCVLQESAEKEREKRIISMKKRLRRMKGR